MNVNEKRKPKGFLFCYFLFLIAAATATSATAVSVAYDTAAVATENNEGDYYYPKALVVLKEIAKASHVGYPPSDLTGATVRSKENTPEIGFTVLDLVCRSPACYFRTSVIMV